MTPITDLNLDNSTISALRHENITTVEQLITMKKIDFLRVRCIGQKRAEKIVRAVEEYKKRSGEQPLPMKN